jgi:hypothetical protein
MLFFRSYNTQGGGWNRTELLREEAATYYQGIFYQGYLITPTNNNRHIIVAAIYHIDILSQ